jgi:hypothetical protein
MNRPPPLQFRARPDGSLTQVPVSIAFVVRVRTQSANGDAPATRGSVMAYRRKKERQHDDARSCTRAAMGLAKLTPADLVPCVVTLVRMSSHHKGLDGHDNLRSALKWVVDGIAEALGIDDGGSAVTWRYGQEQCKRGEFGVTVRITRRSL